MSEATRTAKKPAQPYTKYLVLFLLLTIGSVWGLSLFYLFAHETAVAVLGELELLSPVVIVILHSPAIATLLILLHYDGGRGVANFARTLIPRRRDLIWIPALMLTMLGYIFAVRYLCVAFGVPVPPETLTPLGMALTFLRLLVMEIGMVAIAIGWFGFFLPFVQRVTGSPVVAGVATGLGIGVFVAPGNLFASFELATAWPLYVTQLCVLGVGMALLLNRMKGNVLFFLLPFWVSASGSHFKLYYFMIPTQVIQLVLFSLLVGLGYVLLRRQGQGVLDPPTSFPEYLENAYTTRVGAVLPGVGDASRERRPAVDRPVEPVAVGQEDLA